MAFSESQALAKETEERMIFADLRGDAVSQILRRLTRISSEK
jgi:outer membrane lipopolysaccharide assembly protein LptE/RlpB